MGSQSQTRLSDYHHPQMPFIHQGPSDLLLCTWLHFLLDIPISRPQRTARNQFPSRVTYDGKGDPENSDNMGDIIILNNMCVGNVPAKGTCM